MATLWRDVSIVLGADWAMLPPVPLAGARPRRLTWIGHQHPFAHDGLHGTACELHSPCEAHDEDHGANIVPRCHVNLGQWVVPEHIVRAILPLLGELLVRLRGSHQVHDMLEGAGKPARSIACAALIEETTTRFLGLVMSLAKKWLGHRVHAEGEGDVHEDDEDGDAAGNIHHGLGDGVTIHEAQRDRGDERPTNLRGEGASMLGKHVEAEDDPHTGGQAGSTQVGAPDQTELTDVVERDPVGESHDQVHHAEEEADAHVGLAAPPLLLSIA
mmetsp:Transcript_1930/g.4694  ORF Transcript_1930/g.4694 Transcript_1930/m.4694 type:complete len:272 (-) Transcript_1930:952-1767(-)